MVTGNSPSPSPSYLKLAQGKATQASRVTDPRDNAFSCSVHLSGSSCIQRFIVIWPMYSFMYSLITAPASHLCPDFPTLDTKVEKDPEPGPLPGWAVGSDATSGGRCPCSSGSGRIRISCLSVPQAAQLHSPSTPLASWHRASLPYKAL